jgi:hypothetical protein
MAFALDKFSLPQGYLKSQFLFLVRLHFPEETIAKDGEILIHKNAMPKIVYLCKRHNQKDKTTVLEWMTREQAKDANRYQPVEFGNLQQINEQLAKYNIVLASLEISQNYGPIWAVHKYGIITLQRNGLMSGDVTLHMQKEQDEFTTNKTILPTNPIEDVNWTVYHSAAHNFLPAEVPLLMFLVDLLKVRDYQLGLKGDYILCYTQKIVTKEPDVAGLIATFHNMHLIKNYLTSATEVSRHEAQQYCVDSKQDTPSESTLMEAPPLEELAFEPSEPPREPSTLPRSELLVCDETLDFGSEEMVEEDFPSFSSYSGTCASEEEQHSYFFSLMQPYEGPSDLYSEALDVST